MVTGSRWSDGADIEGHLLAGRAGTVSGRRIRHLHPMNFRAFLAATRPAVALPPAVHPAELQTSTVASSLEEIAFDLDAYDFAWQDYITVGGFPRASFAALWCPQRNDDGRIVVGAQSKLYLADPILSWLPNRLRAGCLEPAFTTLTETTLGVALARSIDELDEGRWSVGPSTTLSDTHEPHPETKLISHRLRYQRPPVAP